MCLMFVRCSYRWHTCSWHCCIGLCSLRREVIMIGIEAMQYFAGAGREKRLVFLALMRQLA